MCPQRYVLQRLNLVGPSPSRQPNAPSFWHGALDLALPHVLTHATFVSPTSVPRGPACRGAADVAPSGPLRLMQRLRTWGLTLAWAAVIVAVTAAPASTLPSAPLLPGLDKLVHAVLFGVLAWLALSARARDHGIRVPLWILVVSLATFAAADEGLQRLVPGRGADWMDWMADMAGVLIAVWLYAMAPARREIVS